MLYFFLFDFDTILELNDIIFYSTMLIVMKQQMLSMPLFFCASAVKKDKVERTRQESYWTTYHPVSSTHFIGVRCAKMEATPGFYPVRISGLSSSVGKITITASIDFLNIRDDLKKLGLRLPGGSMVLSRAKPSVFATEKSEFIESLVNELLNSNTFSMANSAESADYIISASLSVDPNVTVQRSIFQASGKLEFSLNRGENHPVIEIHRTITAGNGRSEEAAVKALKKEAVRIALQEINSTF